MDYKEFLATKHPVPTAVGFDVEESQIHSKLFKYQNAVVRWACRLGRAALFENVGLGKTFQQLEWARLVGEHVNKPVLILAPLGVADQTVREAKKIDIAVKRVYEQSDILNEDRIVITNYDRIHLFDFTTFGGIVLDESSILKHYSKTFFKLVDLCKDIQYRLCATATPAPNDYVELANHAMFLGIMHFKDVLARWFVGEGDLARSARIKEYARDDFWRWVTSWAVCISDPADLGEEYAMEGYDLPKLHIHEHLLSAPKESIDRAWKVGRLIPDDSPSATEFQQVKKDSLTVRVEKTKEIVTAINDIDPVIIWCDTNLEADALMKAFPEAVEVRGSQDSAVKEARLMSFTDGEKRIIITKARIAGFGLNWQHCAEMIFAGVSYSFEAMYQAIGRVLRYGQTRDVNVHLIYAETEGNVMQTLQTKQKAFDDMQAEMNTAIRKYGLFRGNWKNTEYGVTEFDKAEGKDWTYYLGDCVPVTKSLPDDSIDFCVHSPPFAQLYIYSDKDADMGNAATKEEFFEHYRFLIRDLLRVTRPGRCVAVHVKDLPLFQNRDGWMGVDPFSDDVSVAFRAEGWVMQSRITIEKDPVIEMQKTNSHGLLFKNWRLRSEILRTGLPDYVLIFQKPAVNGEEVIPVQHDPADLTYFGSNPPSIGRIPSLPSRKNGKINAALPVWQNYANPNWSDVMVPLVWSDIQQTKVLNYKVAKNDKDERHICPLQLDLIARLIHWKTNPGETVLDPFGGIASTGYEALKLNRKFIGIELKPEYWKLGAKYLREAEIAANQIDLWDWLEMQQAVEPA